MKRCRCDFGLPIWAAIGSGENSYAFRPFYGWPVDNLDITVNGTSSFMELPPLVRSPIRLSPASQNRVGLKPGTFQKRLISPKTHAVVTIGAYPWRNSFQIFISEN